MCIAVKTLLLTDLRDVRGGGQGGREGTAKCTQRVSAAETGDVWNCKQGDGTQTGSARKTECKWPRAVKSMGRCNLQPRVSLEMAERWMFPTTVDIAARNCVTPACRMLGRDPGIAARTCQLHSRDPASGTCSFFFFSFSILRLSLMCCPWQPWTPGLKGSSCFSLLSSWGHRHVPLWLALRLQCWERILLCTATQTAHSHVPLFAN